jgi:hypothetical protein
VNLRDSKNVGFCSEPEATLAAGGVRCLGSTCRRSVGPNPPLVTLSGSQRSKLSALRDASLLDHFVGGGQERFLDCKAKRLGGLEVDHQFELGRLHDR